MHVGGTYTSDVADRDDFSDESSTAGGDFNDKSNNLKDERECDCYGAGNEGECCSTCDMVLDAYKRKGWNVNDRLGIKQCREEAKREARGGGEGEGCEIQGELGIWGGT